MTKKLVNRELVITEDGSHTLFVKDLNEQYHSLHGAIQESNHVFIRSGLNLLLQNKPKNISILEVGFGTGLNALLTYLQSPITKISYTAIEPFPLTEDIVQRLNYPEILDTGERVFARMHQDMWNKLIVLRNNFSLYKTKQKVQDFWHHDKFDLVYFDAFAPQIQPELWSVEVFSHIIAQLNSNAILVTYCAKGSVKRALQKSGFEIESLPGPPVKEK